MDRLSGQTAQNIKDILIGTNSQGKASIGVKMAITTMVTGKMANKMEKAQNLGQMVPTIQVHTRMGISTDLVHINLLKGEFIKVIG